MNNKLLKAAALTLVLVCGSMGGVAWAAAGSQPGSPLYPVRMTVEQMGLTIDTNEVTEAEPQMEFAREQVNEMRQLADDGQDGACPNCDPVRDRDDGCSGGDCDPVNDRDRDGVCDDGDCGDDRADGGHEGDCPDGNCGGDQDGHH